MLRFSKTKVAKEKFYGAKKKKKKKNIAMLVLIILLSQNELKQK